MPLIHSRVEITWYDGSYPSTSGAATLLGADELIDAASPLASSIEQLVQRQEGARWATPSLWPRGNRSSSLEWERVRRAARHDEALAMAMEAAGTMTGETGWVRLDLPDYGRSWRIEPAALRRIESRYRPVELSIAQRYTLDLGAPVEISASTEEGAITDEVGAEILTEDGAFYLALESMA